MRVHPVHVFLSGAFPFQLCHRGLAGSCDALVGAHHAANQSPSVVQRLEGHHELHGGAVGVGNDQILVPKDPSIHFRHDQLVVGAHAPSAAVVHHRDATRCKPWRPVQTDRSARGKQGHVRRCVKCFFHADHLDGLPPKIHGLANRPCRRHRQQLCDRQFLLFQHLQHGSSNHARGPHKGHLQSIASDAHSWGFWGQFCGFTDVRKRLTNGSFSASQSTRFARDEEEQTVGINRMLLGAGVACISRTIAWSNGRNHLRWHGVVRRLEPMDMDGQRRHTRMATRRAGTRHPHHLGMPSIVFQRRHDRHRRILAMASRRRRIRQQPVFLALGPATRGRPRGVGRSPAPMGSSRVA